MAVDIEIPDESYSDFSVPLGGTTYTLNMSYNTRDKNLRLGISYIGNVVFYPETVKAETILFSTQDEDILGGILYCHKINEKSEEITRDNFRTDYSLRFYTTDELTT